MSTPSTLPKVPKALIGPVVMCVPPGCVGLPGVSGIYRITCRPLRRYYIGQTTDLARRWLEHQEQLVSGRHPNAGIQEAYNRLGPLAFTFEALEVLPRRYNEALFCTAEHRWMKTHLALSGNRSSLFNVRPAGTNNWLRHTKAGRIAAQAASLEKRTKNRFTFKG